MKKLITFVLCLCLGILTVKAQQYLCQPYYGTNTIKFYNTNNTATPVFTYNLFNDVTKTWPNLTTAEANTGVNAVAVYNGLIFVSFDFEDQNYNSVGGGVLIYKYADMYNNTGTFTVIKPSTNNEIPNGLSCIGIAINPANGDLYIGTAYNGNINAGGDDSGVYTYTAASAYATGSQFSSYFNDASVAAICADLAFDASGNLWMTTWEPAGAASTPPYPQQIFLICYKGLSSASFYKITNNTTPVYSAVEVNGSTVNSLNLLSGPEGIAFDPAGNLWLGNNNDVENNNSITNAPGQGTLVELTTTYISTLFATTPTNDALNGVISVPSSSTDVNIKYIQNGKLGGLTFSGNMIYVNDQGQNQGNNPVSSGTVWQWDVTSAFNSTNFKASGIPTTYPGNGTSALMTGLYVQDDPTDNGTEPNITATVAYQSSDIWVQEETGGANPTNEQIVAGQTGYVYVRVHNASMFPTSSSDQLYLYWAKGGTGLSWPIPWTNSPPQTPTMGEAIVSGQAIPVIQPGQTTIITVPWNDVPNPADYTAMFPDQSGHFCLLARLVTSTTAPYGMTYTEGTDLWSNVVDNNKIAWRNISILPVNSPCDNCSKINTGGIILANYTGTAMNTILKFELQNAGGQPMPIGTGKLIIKVKGTWLDKFTRSTAGNKYVKSDGNGQFTVLDIENGIGNISLSPGEILPLNIAYVPGKNMEGYLLRASQYAVEGTKLKIIGGQTFVYGKVKGYPIGQVVKGGNVPYWVWWLICIIIMLLLIFYYLKNKKK